MGESWWQEREASVSIYLYIQSQETKRDGHLHCILSCLVQDPCAEDGASYIQREYFCLRQSNVANLLQAWERFASKVILDPVY